MIRSKRQMYLVIGVFALVMMLGTVTYAFFNYTRTGTANNIRTGRIYFNADQGNNTVTLSDLFPISLGENETITSETPGVGSLKLHITGDTNYTEGIEYLIETVDVTGNGQTSLPISIDISYAPTAVEQGEDPNVIGTADENYFANRGGATSRYKLLSTGSISEGEDILVGYIAPGNTGIDGELTILAYLDAENIAITDTYPGGTKREVVANYDTNACETALEGDATAQALCADSDGLQAAVDTSELTNAQITALLNAGVITEYTDDTTSEWVDDRAVFTTDEWNALQATGVSFKIRATAQEGTWVPEPIPTIPSCPGCVFVYTYTPMYAIWNTENHDPTELTSSDYSDDYRIAINKNFNPDEKIIFLGVILDNNKISRAFACGLIGGTVPFCLEGTQDGSKDMNNIALMHSDNLYGNLCDNLSNNSGVQCNGTPNAISKPIGDVAVFKNGNQCDVSNTGILKCN